jgi:hypothetical protein
MLSWATAGGHLIQDGVFRAAHAINRIASGEMLPHQEAERVKIGRKAERRHRALQLATLAFVVSALATVTGDSPQLGMNLFTAEVIFVASVVMMLIGTTRRLA